MDTDSVEECQEMCEWRRPAMACKNVEYCTFTEGNTCGLYRNRLTDAEVTYLKYDCTQYYKRAGETGWRAFDDQEVVDPNHRGTMVEMVNQGTIQGCKVRCTRNNNCHNIEYCTNGGNAHTCILYDRQLTGNEAVRNHEHCTQYYRH